MDEAAYVKKLKELRVENRRLKEENDKLYKQNRTLLTVKQKRKKSAVHDCSKCKFKDTYDKVFSSTAFDDIFGRNSDWDKIWSNLNKKYRR